MKVQILAYLNGTISDEDLKILLGYLRASGENLNYFNKVKEEWENNPDKVVAFSGVEGWKVVNDQLFLKDKNNNVIFKRIVSVAALLFVALVSGLVFITLNQQAVTVKTADGQQVKLVMPDSTVINLNSNSQLSYKQYSYFFDKEVNLSGEAYFDVAHQTIGNFNVNAGNVNITVLGTKFNVNTQQEEEHIEVVLEEGVVELSMDGDDSFKKTLRPGQKAVLDTKAQKVTLGHVEAALYSSWKSGVIYCKNVSVEDFFGKVGEKYGVTFVIDKNKQLNNLIINFTIKNDQLDDLLEVVELTVPVKIVLKKSCYRVMLDQKRYDMMY